MNPDAVKVVMFDYDGVLRDAMNPHLPGTKPHAFAKAVVDFQPSLRGRETEISGLYFATSGKNRIYQLHYVEEQLGIDSPVKAEQEKNWSDSFNSFIDTTNLPLFPEAIDVTKELKKRGYTLMIGSSVPQERLESEVTLFPDLEENMDLILGNQKMSKGVGTEGNFIKGVPYVSFVTGWYLGKSGVLLKPEEIAFIGDAPEDMKAGYEAGSFTIGITNHLIPGTRERLEKHDPDRIILGLSELLEIFTDGETK